MNLLAHRCIGSTHLFGTLEYLSRYGNPFIEKKQKKLDPIFKFLCRQGLHLHHGEHLLHYHTQRLNRKGLPDKRSAVGFCLGSGLFGSYNSD